MGVLRDLCEVCSDPKFVGQSAEVAHDAPAVSQGQDFTL